MNVDFHLHSTWSDGQNSIQQILQRAKENNLTEIAITDHIRKESTYFDDYQQEIDSLNETEKNLNIYSGFEAKVSDFTGNIDVCEDVVNKSDLAIISVHRYPLGAKLYKASEFSKQVANEIELELSLAAMKKGGFNVLGHPGGMSLVFHQEFPMDFFEEIISHCAKYDIAFDFNGRYHGHLLRELCHLFAKHNPHISIGTDSHHIDKMQTWNDTLKEFTQ